MTETKGVKDSGKDKPKLVDEDSVVKVGKEMEIGGDKDKGREEFEEEEEEVEVEEEEEVEIEEEVEVEEEEEEVEEEQEEEEEEEEVEEEQEEETEESEEDEQEKEVLPGSEDIPDDSRKKLQEEVALAKDSGKDIDSPTDGVRNSKGVHVGNVVSKSNDADVSEEVPVIKACNSIHADVPGSDASLTSNMGTVEKLQVKDEKEALKADTEDGDDAMLDAHVSPNHQGVDDEVIARNHAAVDAPNKGSSALNVELMKEEELKNEASNKEGAMDAECRNPNSSCIFDTDTSGGGESGTEDEQAAFMIELEKFHKEKFLEFKPPKFYGEPLNLLKLWRAVMKLGGYDKVTACKYWRQVGESFKPPKTCTTVSWTFRIFYEKALLEYERHRSSGDGADIPASLPMSMSVENQASGSGRARRDAAARAMQGWHSQRILDNGEVSDPIIKDKNSTSLSKREKQLKNLSQSILKRKRPPSMDAAVKDVRPKVPKSQSETTVIDIGSPADWVKINVRATKDCYEVYALVPGLLREEVRVQSDPAGRLVISGEPENPDNPWNVTPFKKVVNLPTRIDPHQTSAVVTLHGQLFVRVPFEQYD